MNTTIDQPRANKTDAGNGSKAICRVFKVHPSPSPDPRRSPNLNTSPMMPDSMPSASDKWRSFLAAFQLERFGTGRHISRDDRGFKIAEQRIEGLWLVSIQPNFARSAFLMVAHPADRHPLALFCFEGADGLPIIRSSPAECPALNDQFARSLKKLDLWPSTDTITRDGIGYSIHLRTYAVSADISFANPETESLRLVEKALFGVARSVASITNDAELTDYLTMWQGYLS